MSDRPTLQICCKTPDSSIAFLCMGRVFQQQSTCGSVVMPLSQFFFCSFLIQCVSNYLHNMRASSSFRHVTTISITCGQRHSPKEKWFMLAWSCKQDRYFILNLFTTITDAWRDVSALISINWNQHLLSHFKRWWTNWQQSMLPSKQQQQQQPNTLFQELCSRVDILIAVYDLILKRCSPYKLHGWIALQPSLQ